MTNPNQKSQPERKNFGVHGSDSFDGDTVIRIAEIAECSIIKWTLELSDELDIPLDELATIKMKLKEFLDEEVY